MKDSRCVVVCLVLLGAAVLAGCEKQAPADNTTPPAAVTITDVDRLQGTWQGTEASSTELWTLVIDGDQLDVDGPGPADYSATLTVDETADPKTATILIKTCGYQQYVGTTANSIYRLDGDALTMAATEPGSGTRPADFVPSDATKVFTLNRVRTP